MTHIYTLVHLIKNGVQIGKKYFVLHDNTVYIAEVLDEDTARIEIAGLKFERGINTMLFLMELPEEKRQQSIFDNPYYAVEAARLQGKTIQLKAGGRWKDWNTHDAPSYTFPPDYYRIKPETKTVYRYRYELEDVYGQIASACWTSNDATSISMVKHVHENSSVFKKWIIEPECTPIEVEVQ